MAKFVANNRQCLSAGGKVHAFEQEKDKKGDVITHGFFYLEPKDKAVIAECKRLAKDESTTVLEVKPKKAKPKSKPKKAKKK